MTIFFEDDLFTEAKLKKILSDNGYKTEEINSIIREATNNKVTIELQDKKYSVQKFYLVLEQDDNSCKLDKIHSNFGRKPQ